MSDQVGPRRLIAFLAMCVGMFMALLDVQVVSASIAEIQAGLAAKADEMQTAYLIAEVISIPLSGFLSRALGMRLLFAGSAAGFTIASLMCGLASSMEEMIVWRAAQGFMGGGMIPTVFAAVYVIFPRPRIPVTLAMVGLIATLAPTIGPTVGGYVTEMMSWNWLFFINLPFGIFVFIAAVALIDFDEPDFALLTRFDWWGLLFMATFLGSLEYVLEEGRRNDWFEDDTITFFAVACVLGAAAFFWRAFTAVQPIVDLRAFADRNFALGCMFLFVLGIGIFGLTYLYPAYLAGIRGHDARMIGETVFVSGATMFLCAPIVSRLLDKIEPQLMVVFGFMVSAAGSWQMSLLTKDFDFWELLLPQMLRGAGVIFAIVPLTNAALGTLPRDALKNACGLFSLMRNLGGAVGLAALSTLLDKRLDLHLNRLHEAVNSASRAAGETQATLSALFRNFAGDAPNMALKHMMFMVRQQSTVMAFADVFWVLAVLFVTFGVVAMLVPLRPPAPMTAGTSALADAPPSH